MKAVQITQFGGPDVMQYLELPDPTPGSNEVLIDVTAIGINYADTHQTENSYLSAQTLPMIPGLEVTGLVDGKRFLAPVSSGGYAQKVYPAPSLPGPQPFTVGAAGASSSFGVAPATVITATAGAGGGSVTGANGPSQTIAYGAGGAGGSGSNGDLNISGATGGHGIASQRGGTSLMSNEGADYSSPNSNGNAGQAYGGGGTGASATPGAAALTVSGGAGTSGLVIVEEFY